ncbi:MAG: hypothetical protein LUB59_05530 [Candidatus Gastranaerophilales bacterium]|nr:hypothetical protein [Candidatus Gastranaerophilales bacterium]
MDKIVQTDCMTFMPQMGDSSANLVLTDIPYGVVSRPDNGLRNLDKDKADIETFELAPFLEQIYRIVKSTAIIFCAKEQLSEIYGFFDDKAKSAGGYSQAAYLGED